MPEEEVPFREAMALNAEGGYENPVHVAEDNKTGEQFTIYEDKAPIRGYNGGKVRGKKFDVDENMLMYQNYLEIR